jgi:polysaccharide export outer membrane protein
MRRTTAMWIFLALALASLPAPAAGQDSTQAKDPAPASQAGPTYVIGPDDTLYISVWKEPDLTETLPVRAEG